MQHTLKVNPEHNLLLLETQGEGTAKGIIAFLDDIIAHPIWHPGMSVLMDHRRLSLDKLSYEGIQQVSDYFASISDDLGNGKFAAVMNREVDFGITRAWQNMTMDRTSIQTFICRSMDEARAWLLEDSTQP